MDPNLVNPQGDANRDGSQKLPADPTRPTYPDLHAEGIDIVTGSGIVEENEFTGKEGGAQPPADLPTAEPQKKEVPPAPPVPAAPTPKPQYQPIRSMPAQREEIPVPEFPAKNDRKGLDLAKAFSRLENVKPVSQTPPPQPVRAKEYDGPKAEKMDQEETPQKSPVAQQTQSKLAQGAPVDREPLPPQQMMRQPSEEEKPAESGVMNDPSIKPLRTFKSDAEEAVRYQNVSVVNIAVAAHKKKEAEPMKFDDGKSSSPAVMIVIVFLIILALGGGWYYWFISSQNVEERSVASVDIPTIIPFAKGGTLVLDPGSDPLALISSKLAASNAGLGNVYAVIPVLSSTSTTLAPISTIFGATDAPSRLVRSLSDRYMIGSYTYEADNPFFVLKNTFFQNAFSGMLEWEKTMRNDLLSFIQISHPNEKIRTGDAATFEDLIVSNIDARVLRGQNGDPILLYAFADKDTIVVTTSQNALKFLLDKLLIVRTIQ